MCGRPQNTPKLTDTTALLQMKRLKKSRGSLTTERVTRNCKQKEENVLIDFDKAKCLKCTFSVSFLKDFLTEFLEDFLGQIFWIDFLDKF